MSSTLRVIPGGAVAKRLHPSRPGPDVADRQPQVTRQEFPLHAQVGASFVNGVRVGLLLASLQFMSRRIRGRCVSARITRKRGRSTQAFGRASASKQRGNISQPTLGRLKFSQTVLGRWSDAFRRHLFQRWPQLLPGRTQDKEVQGANDSPATPDDDGSKLFQKQYFFDADDLKSQLRERLIKDTYDVRNFYKTTGIFQTIARSKLFETMTLGVIGLNALWIGIDIDFNSADTLLDAHPVFQVADNCFCLFFFVEWFVRFMSFKKKRHGFRDNWFVFDTILVALMVLETWVMTAAMWVAGPCGALGGLNMGDASLLRIFRLLRLSRMTRMVRLLRTMPELVILVKSLVEAFRSLFFTFCLLVVMLYVFSITFRQIASGNAVLTSLYFDSIPRTMYILMVHGTFLDNLSTVATNIGQQSVLGLFIFWVFVALSAMMVMNMLIGILCEVVSAVSATEKEAVLVSFVKERMQKLFAELDVTGDGRISRSEFLLILQSREACVLLQDVGVDVVGLVDQVDFIFEQDPTCSDPGERELDFPDLMELVLSLRGTCSATVKDIIDLRKLLRNVSDQTGKSLAQISKRVDALQANSSFRHGSELPSTLEQPTTKDRGASSQQDPQSVVGLTRNLESRLRILCEAAESLAIELAEIRRVSALSKASIITFKGEDADSASSQIPPLRG